MTARVVDVNPKRSSTIQGDLENEVEVTAAANEENIYVLKKEQKCLYEHKSLANRQNFAIVSHEESSDDNFLTSHVLARESPLTPIQGSDSDRASITKITNQRAPLHASIHLSRVPV